MLKSCKHDFDKDAHALLHVTKRVRKGMPQHAKSFNVDFDNHSQCKCVPHSMMSIVNMLSKEVNIEANEIVTQPSLTILLRIYFNTLKQTGNILSKRTVRGILLTNCMVISVFDKTQKKEIAKGPIHMKF